MPKHAGLLAVLLLGGCGGGGSNGGADAATQSADAASQSADAASHSPDAPPPPDAAPDADLRPTVSGTVLDNDGYPHPGAKIAASGSTAMSGDGGAFTLRVPATPYDLMVNAGGTVVVMHDLTRLDPVVQVPVLQPPEGQGTVKGAIPALATFQDMTYATILPTNVRFGESASTFVQGPGTAMYSLTQRWQPQSSAAEGTLYLLQVMNSSQQNAGTIVGLSEVPITVAAGGNATFDVPTLGSVQTQTITANLTLPGGWSRQEFRAVMRPAGKRGRIVVDQWFVGTMATFHVPALAGASYEVFVRAVGPNLVGESKIRKTVAAGGSVDLAFLTPPVVTSPAADATDVGTDTSISFTGGSSVNIVDFQGQSGGAPRIFVITARQSFTLPDPSAVGLTLPHGASYFFEVKATTGRSSVDAFADANPADSFCITEDPRGEDYQCASAQAQSFKTK